MDTKKLCCGIDVSQKTLDVSYQNNLGDLFYIKVPNSQKGFEEIIRHTGLQYHFVMEATGVYYMNLAFYLHNLQCAVSVVNALTIKRYIQMHLERNKNDKKMRNGFVNTPSISNLNFGKCPTLLTFSASNCIMPSAPIANR